MNIDLYIYVHYIDHKTVYMGRHHIGWINNKYFFLFKHIEESFAETQYLCKYQCSRQFLSHMAYDLFCKIYHATMTILHADGHLGYAFQCNIFTGYQQVIVH